jgi:hypothetical protein
MTGGPGFTQVEQLFIDQRIAMGWKFTTATTRRATTWWRRVLIGRGWCSRPSWRSRSVSAEGRLENLSSTSSSAGALSSDLEAEVRFGRRAPGKFELDLGFGLGALVRAGGRGPFRPKGAGRL